MKAGRRTQAGIAAAVAPLTVLGAAWAGSLSATLPGGQPAAVGGAAALAPPETTPPSINKPLVAPASRTRVAAVRGGVVVASARTSAHVPTLALAAYQRAEAVLGSADPGCRVSWALLAAVGDVESNHGRYGGSTLDAEGRATPAIIGMRLDGSGATAAIADSDAGELDGDRRWDRAVGPLQFIPSTWALVGVDADGDSRRDPQDIDDAALAAAVYLCSGPENLATDAGRRVAVRRYNHSDSYVDLVLRLMEAYADGSLTITASAQPMLGRQIGPVQTPTPEPKPDDDKDTPEPSRPQAATAPPAPAPTPTGEPLAPGGQTLTPAVPEEPTEEPTEEPSGEPTGEPSVEPSEEPSAEPSTQPSEEPSTQPSEEPSAEPSTQPSAGATTTPDECASTEPSEAPSDGPVDADGCPLAPEPEGTPDPTAGPTVSSTEPNGS